MTWNNLLRFKRAFYLSALLGALLPSPDVLAKTQPELQSEVRPELQPELQLEQQPPFITELITAWQQNRLLPLLSESCVQCDIQDAYQLQRLAVAQISGARDPAGFKAGLTTIASQRKFAAPGPVYGVLWPGSQITELQRVEGVILDHWLRPMMELELAFRFPHGLPNDLSRKVDAASVEVALAIELPDLAFSPGAVSAIDIVATNVAARRFAVGAPRRLQSWSQLESTWTLERDGVRAQQGLLSAVDHEVALMHALSHLESQSYRLQPGQWLLTGALAGMRPAQRGIYELTATGMPALRLKLR